MINKNHSKKKEEETKLLKQKNNNKQIEFFHNAPENNNLQNLFKTKSNFTSSRNRDRGLDHQIDTLNNIDLEGMDIFSKNNLSKMEQSELSKLINDKTIILKPADKRGAVVVISTEHYKTMIMQQLDYASTYKKLDLNIDMKIHKNLKNVYTNTVNVSQHLNKNF